MGTLIFWFAIIYAIVGAWRFFRDINEYLQVRREFNASLSWPSTTGEIVSSNMIKSTETIPHYFSLNSRLSGQSESKSVYNPEIEYSYTVDGNSYEGSKITFGVAIRNIRNIDWLKTYDWIRRYQQGAVVKVYYDPRDPGNSVLERKLTGNYASSLARELFIVLAGVCIAILLASNNFKV